MPTITYTAIDRGRLKSGHTASTSYKIELDFESFPEQQIRKGEFAETLDGTQEVWLDALQYQYQIQTEYLPNTGSNSREDMQEFFSSVAAGETFQVDFTGTIASPGTAGRRGAARSAADE